MDRLVKEAMIFARNVLDLFDGLPLLLNSVKMDPCFLSNKKIGNLGDRIYPFHHKYLLEILLDLNLSLACSKMCIEMSLTGQKYSDVLLIVID